MNKPLSPSKEKKARLWNIVYYMVAAVIIAATLLSAFRGRDNYVSETYGTTNDTQQNLEDGMEIRVDFKIPRNHFKGISVRFFAETKKQYGNETLLFYLRDNTSGTRISEYELDLNKTLPQVGNFIPLPFEESEGKEVSLYISGNNIRTAPAFCLSETANMKSELFVGSKHRRAYSLVFSAVYSEHQAVNIQALVKGLMILFLWVLTGIWPVLYRKGQKTAAAGEKTVHLRKLPGIPGSFRKALLFLLLSLLYLFLSIFVYYNNVEETMTGMQSADLVTSDGREAAIVMDSSDDILIETFTAREDALSSVSFEVSAGKKNRGAMLHVRLSDLSTDILLHDEYVGLGSLPSSRSVWKLYLNTEYALSADKDIQIQIEPVGFKSSEVLFYTGQAKDRVSAIAEGVRTGNLPVLAVSYSDNGFLRPLYRSFAVLLYLFLAMAYLMIVVLKWGAERIFVPVCIFLGIIYMLVIPVYSVPDEYAHIDTSYSLSNRLLGIPRPEGMDGYDYRREADVETEEYFTYNASMDDYRRLYKEFRSAVPDQQLTPCVMRATDSNVNLLYFVPSALGIAVGRVLGLATLPVYLLGRLFNLIAFVLLSWLAIRRLSGMKEVFFLYVSLPIGLQQAASFSYDSMLDAVGLLFFAYCVYFAYEKSFPGPADVFLLLFSALQLATVKGGVYFPVCLFLLLIPLERRWKLISNIPFYLLMGGFIFMGFLQGNISSLLTRLLPGSGTRVNAFTGTAVYTFGYLLHHPVTIVRLYTNTVFLEGSRLIYEFFGGKMGSVKNIQMPWIYPCIFMVIFAIAVYRSRSDYRLRRISKALCALVTILALLLIGLAMLLANTTKDMYYISGLQGRYYIPVMLIPLLCLMKEDSAGRGVRSAGINTKTAAARDNDSSPAAQEVREAAGAAEASSLFMWYCLAHVVFLLNIVMVVFPATMKV